MQLKYINIQIYVDKGNRIILVIGPLNALFSRKYLAHTTKVRAFKADKILESNLCI